MSDKPKPWPYKAAYARDNVAMDMIAIDRELTHLRDLVKQGDLSRLDVMVSVDFIRQRAHNALLLMKDQGAPVELPR